MSDTPPQDEIHGRGTYQIKRTANTSMKAQCPERKMSSLQGKGVALPIIQHQTDEPDGYQPNNQKISKVNQKENQKIQQNSPSKETHTDTTQVEEFPQVCSNKTSLLSDISILLSFVIAITAIIIFYYSKFIAINAKQNFRKQCHLSDMIYKYPMEEESLWISLKIGIEDILNHEGPQELAVYLFLHDEGSRTDFVNDIAKLSASCFGPQYSPVILQKDDFDSDDFGIAIVKFKEGINDGGGVSIVTVELNEVPGKAARALHPICDKFSPIVKKVIIFLSLEIDPNEKGKPLIIAENTLRKLWKSSLTRNELEPLIARISDNVFRLQT